MRDASLEAFLIHARNLIDFFIGPSNQRPNDILASDFFVDPIVWRGVQRSGLDRDRERIGRKLAHLTYHRINDHEAWNPRDMILRISDLRDRFNALGPRYRIEFDIGGGPTLGPSVREVLPQPQPRLEAK
jgi:hypothetical protein